MFGIGHNLVAGSFGVRHRLRPDPGPNRKSNCSKQTISPVARSAGRGLLQPTADG